MTRADTLSKRRQIQREKRRRKREEELLLIDLDRADRAVEELSCEKKKRSTLGGLKNDLPPMFYIRPDESRHAETGMAQERTANMRDAMPSAFKVKPLARRHSRELKEIKELQEIMMASGSDDSEHSCGSEAAEKVENALQQGLRRFLLVISAQMLVLMAILLTVSLVSHLALGKDRQFRETADQYGAQFMTSFVFVASLGGFFIWTRGLDKPLSGVLSKVLFASQYLAGLVFFVLIYYYPSHDMSLAVQISIWNSTINVLVYMLWCMPKKHRLPSMRSWIKMTLMILVADSTLATSLMLEANVDYLQALLGFITSMINHGLLIIITNSFFKSRISLMTYAKDESCITWPYIYPSVVAYSLLLFVIVTFALLLQFPRIVKSFRDSAQAAQTE